MKKLTIPLKTTFIDVLKDSEPARRVASKFKMVGNYLIIDKYQVNLKDFDKLYVFGAGKAAKQVATGLNQLLGDRIFSGCVISPIEKPETVGNITILPGDHPLPGPHSVSSSNTLLSQLKKVTSKDLVLFITTGGASSMYCVPEDGFTWQDLRMRTQELLRSGADIYEMNHIRSQWDKVKAGKTLSFAKPKGWVNLLISDVPGDDPFVIGSGPAIASNSHPKAWVPEIYGLVFIDTPYEFASLLGAKLKVQHPNAEVIIDETSYNMDVEYVSEVMIQNTIVEHLSLESNQAVIMVFHGESTIKVEGDGLGGRNHHLGLLLLSQLDDLLPENIDFTVLSAGTDGIDGNTGAAGIICDRAEYRSIVKKKGKPSKFLSTFDSGSFFSGFDCVIKTGPTGTNLMDIQVIVCSMK